MQDARKLATIIAFRKYPAPKCGMRKRTSENCATEGRSIIGGLRAYSAWGVPLPAVKCVNPAESASCVKPATLFTPSFFIMVLR